MGGAVFQFGVGHAFLTPVGGNTAANPTPMRLMTLQSVTVDFTVEMKELYGQNQFPDDVAPGKRKVTWKAKKGRIDNKAIGDLVFGQAAAAGTIILVAKEAATAVVSAFTVANSATFADDLGVYYAATGAPLVKIASGTPATGQYKVTAGVYTLSTADATASVLVYYTYSSAGSGQKLEITNQLNGFGPVLQLHLFNTYKSNTVGIKLYSAVLSKFTYDAKQDDYTIPDLEGVAFADSSDRVVGIYTST